ncbi:LysR family transcriptional regulator [Citrobacter braakii]|nr:LysR family transcriptional regulator [Citrobacter braakii]
MIEIKHLKTLQALRNSGSLAAAAATLHQTQSALSHQFSDLEQRLGFRLFIRKSQPLRFTPQGEILLQLANQVLPQIGRALQACNEPQQTRLRIAIECHSCIQWLTPALENFRANWPQVEMDFKSGVTFDPQPALQQDELDLVLTSDILPRSGLHYSPMFDFEVRLVLAPDHPLASKTQITPEDLASETLLIYPVQRSRLDVWRHFLQPAGVSPSLKSVDNTLLLIQMVAARMGIAALPHWVVESFERQGLVVTKTLGDGLWSRLYAAVRDGEQRQPVTEAFIRSARNHACDHLPFVRECGTTHFRCTHSEATITAAPIMKLGQ